MTPMNWPEAIVCVALAFAMAWAFRGMCGK